MDLALFSYQQLVQINILLVCRTQVFFFFKKESILDFDKASPSAIVSSQPPSVTPASSPVGR